LNTITPSASAASWLSCKFSSQGCVEILGKNYNRDEMTRIFDACYLLREQPVNRFFNTRHMDYKGSSAEKLIHGWGLAVGDSLYDLGLRFKYIDGAQDPEKNRNTLLYACRIWIADVSD
jgi:hypothetical protein